MELPNKTKENKNEGKILPAFVFLREPMLDIGLFIKDFQKDWGIEIPILDKEKSGDDSATLVTQINDMNIAVSLMSAPVPNGEAVENAKTRRVARDTPCFCLFSITTTSLIYCALSSLSASNPSGPC